MTNKELNTKVYERMVSEQAGFRTWLLSLSPQEILNNAYRYCIREDILMEMEEIELSDEQATALLKVRNPLAEVYRQWEDIETGHMDQIRDTIETRANKLSEQAKNAKIQQER